MKPDEISETTAIKFQHNQLAKAKNGQVTLGCTSTQDKHDQESLLKKHKAEDPAEPWYFAHI